MKPKIPFNIGILHLTDDVVKNLQPVEVVDVFDGLSNNFHDQGLFSVEIFGEVGSPERDTQFSYINLNTKILNPIMYERLVKLKSLYKDIMLGTRYAEFDEILKDFVPSTPLDGDTGYAFFVKHLPKIEFKKNNSPRRNIMVDIIEKYRKNLFIDKYVVLPAGLRDLTVDDNGQSSEDEINEMYRRMISISNSMRLMSTTGRDDAGLDMPRKNLQLIAYEIYRYIHGIIDDKKGFAQARFGSRNVFNGTRNVLSAMDTSVEIASGIRSPDINTTHAGLFQTMKGILPMTIHRLRNHPLYLHAFTGDAEFINLVNKKTLKSERVDVDQFVIDNWQSVEGIEKLVQKFSQPEMRYKPITISGHYFGLIYKDEEKFQILKDIDELPEGWDKNNVQPIRYIEYVYAAMYPILYDQRGMLTRYPVTGMGSTYPCKIYTKTTTSAKSLQEYENGDKLDQEPAREFPWVNPGEEPTYFSTTSAHSSFLSGLGADHDGEMWNNC